MSRYFHSLFLLIIFSIVPSLGMAQSGFYKIAEILRGEGNPETSFANSTINYLNRTFRYRMTRTEKEVIISTGTTLEPYRYRAGYEIKIISAAFKANNPNIVEILLNNKKTVAIYISYSIVQEKHSFVEITRDINNAAVSNPIKLFGDALYMLSNGKVFASWDTAKTWVIDSTNIGTETVNDIAIDTNFYGWVITQNRNLYYQHPDSNIWRKDTSFKTTGTPRAIFVDRKGRMFIYTTASVAQGRVVMSTDGGVSFTNISTGIVDAISSFGDDAFGNIYAVSTGSSAYRLSNLTPPWVPIGDSINAQAYLPSSEKIINSISGDTILYAATRYGMFQSTDYGSSWAHSPRSDQSQAHNFYTGVVKGGNYYFVSTNLGIYRVASGDSVWEKVFPKQGFIYGVNILISDSAGNVYGNLPIKTGPSSWLFYTVKSTDYGVTWIPDTAGFKSLGITAGTQTYDFWVDRQGTQYLGGNARFLTKKPRQAWKLDTAGLGMQANQYIKTVTLNNTKGITYLSRTVFSGTLKLFIYSKTVNDTAWKIVNSSTLAAGDGILMSDQDGNIIVKAFSSPEKIWRYNGSTWAEIPFPTTIGSSPTAFPLTVDKNGVIWAAFFAGGSNKGVYFTTNNGTSWNYVGLNGVGIKFLNAVDDSSATFRKSSGSSSLPGVFAVTFIDGVYRFTTTSQPTTVEDRKTEILQSYELFQNYPNPFNPTTTISFALPKQSLVTIKIFDILGREVATLLNEEKKEGTYSVPFNGSKLSSGVYFYRIQAGEFMNTKKLLLQK